jgi:hypothetical protein
MMDPAKALTKRVEAMSEKEMDEVLAEDPWARVKALEKRMRQLQWQRDQNATMIQDVMVTAKAMQDDDNALKQSIDKSGQRASWMQAVIADELAKPLEVTHEFASKFEAEEERRRSAQQRSLRQQKKLIKSMRKRLGEAAARMEAAEGKSGEGGGTSVRRSTGRLRLSASQSLDKLKTLAREVKVRQKQLRAPSKSEVMLTALSGGQFQPVLRGSARRTGGRASVRSRPRRPPMGASRSMSTLSSAGEHMLSSGHLSHSRGGDEGASTAVHTTSGSGGGRGAMV